ncbi:MAG: ferritin [Nanoarchaeota archaeon]
MNIKKPMTDALNIQIKNEFASGYLYLSMAAYFEGQNLAGFAKWMRLQYEEEFGHGMKMFDHVLARGGKITLLPLEKPKGEWSSAIEVFEQIVAHEQAVTKMINDLYELAMEEKEFATKEFLHWFLAEQVEEEEHSSEILGHLKMASKNGLLMLDHRLGKRGNE